MWRALFFVEGESDAVAAESVGLPAVAVGGTQGWRSYDAERFRDRRVVVVFDCDEAGRTAAKRVAKDLSGVAEQVRVLDLDPHRNDG